MLPIKKILIASSAIFSLCFLSAGYVGNVQVEAAVVTAPFEMPYTCTSGCDSLGGLNDMDIFSGWMTGTFQKVFNLKKSDGALMPSSFTLNIDETVTSDSGATTGNWVARSGYQMNNTEYQLSLESRLLGPTFIREYVLRGGVSVPADEGLIRLSSSDPSIVQCSNIGCVAVRNGVAQITVVFEDKSLTSPYGFYSSPEGFGQVLVRGRTGRRDIATNLGFGFAGGGSYSFIYDSYRYRAHAYSFPSITYTVTVKGTPNSPHVVTYERASAITETSATVHWTYTDPDGDPQTGWHVQVSTDPTFTDLDNTFAASGSGATLNAAFSGLTPDTTYHVRVRASNDVNGMSVWSYGEFKTLTSEVPEPPCEVDCGNDSGGTPVVQCSGPGELSAGTSGRFEVRTQNLPGPLSYAWKHEAVNISTNQIITYSFASQPAPRTEELIVTVTSGQSSRDARCFVYIEGTGGGGGGGGGEDPSTDPQILKFEIAPNIVPSGASCPLFLEAVHVQSCVVNRGTIPVASMNPIVADIEGKINFQGAVSPGSYTSTCTSATGATIKSEIRQCISNPNVREF